MSVDIVPDRYIAAIPIELLDAVWSDVAPLLQLAIDESPDENTIDSVKRDIYSGQVLLLTLCSSGVIDIAVTLSVREFETGKKALYIPLVGGSGMEKHFDDFIRVVSDIAIQGGCDQLRGFAARGGWLRYLKKGGWEEVHTTIRLRL